ncbi:hypothetical protein G8J22_00186 [Lentilactobacillus hilgardii]|uniref:hypothetical protein n=1 Tax=Lentilactobacillus hilgardii TaxID=1588 RepID=UPI00019C5318|nr:hypothetical protein [Lentilactobacillus hilgardii]EEI20803.1 hypothetical protein HMPREF0497_0460 [Lentilactobacillus buchneri ATCC 11577]MCT3395032.1 hypothetical protein [Lentilactobacillus hilgardii]QIR08252.1 hypothetical protein G8J22_00186 [Lentilactobacillus hilgardii]
MTKFFLKLVIGILLFFMTTQLTFSSRLAMFLTVAIINIVALILLSSAIADAIKSYIKKKKL